MKTSKLRRKEYGLEKYLPPIYRSQRIMDDSEVKWILLGGLQWHEVTKDERVGGKAIGKVLPLLRS